MTKTPAKPRLSATVLLVRDAPDLQVLMVRRHYEIDFAAGALVFPGGKASADDARDDWTDWADGAFTGEQRTARVAAAREAFEEVGVLLARHAGHRGNGAPLVAREVCDRLSPKRGPIDRGEESFLDLMRAENLVLALDQLIHFGHWITPEMMPKRFDTHFYLAPAAEGQLAAHDGRETTDAVWIGPHEALEKEAAGEATIIFPTRLNLRRLGIAKAAAAALETFAGTPVETVLPKLSQDGEGRPCLVIPDIDGYGQTVEPLENVKV